jgi:hypothetical protein
VSPSVPSLTKNCDKARKLRRIASWSSDMEPF